MSRTQKWYDLKSATALRNYAESNFRMRPTDKKLYKALQSLESQQDGLCKDVVANHRTIARAAKIDRKTVGVVLKRLEAIGLIKYTPGSKTYADHKASRICRNPFRELKEIIQTAQPAYRLEAILNKRSIAYGNEIVRPTFNVRTTNRLYASNPNVLGKKEARPRKLARGCGDGQILIELDFKAAEPSVIAQRLGYKMDGYSIIDQAEGGKIDDVKSVFNPIVYTRNCSTITTARKHGIQSPKALEFLTAVDGLREELRRPLGKPARHTTTEMGTKIEVPLKRKVHNGTLLSYYAQGTIADFINKAALEIILLEKQRGWRLVTPCHDAVYVIARQEQIEELQIIILNQTEPTTLEMELKIKRWNKEGNQLTQGSTKKAVHNPETDMLNSTKKAVQE